MSWLKIFDSRKPQGYLNKKQNRFRNFFLAFEIVKFKFGKDKYYELKF